MKYYINSKETPKVGDLVSMKSDFKDPYFLCTVFDIVNNLSGAGNIHVRYSNSTEYCYRANYLYLVRRYNYPEQVFMFLEVV